MPLVHKRSDTKNTAQRIQNTVNTSRHTTKTFTHYSTHTLQNTLRQPQHKKTNTVQVLYAEYLSYLNYFRNNINVIIDMMMQFVPRSKHSLHYSIQPVNSVEGY